MKGLVEFIKESNIQIFENRIILNQITKAVKDGSGSDIYSIIKHVVDGNDSKLIDAKDVDDLEDGMFIGYLPGGMKDPQGVHRLATIAIVSRKSTDDSKQWIILTDDLYKGEDIGVDIVDFKDAKLYANYYGNAWKILYFEHVDEDLLEAVLSIH